MKNLPKKIYLQVVGEGEINEEEDFNKFYPREIPWSQVRLNDNDFKFIRIDLDKEKIESFIEQYNIVREIHHLDDELLKFLNSIRESM